MVLVAMAVVVVLSTAMAGSMADGHAKFHVIFGLIGAVPAAVIASRPTPGRAAILAVVAFELLAITQLVESVGAWGFGPDNSTVVSDIKGVHDLGLALAPIGLVGGVVGLAIVAGEMGRQRLGTVGAAVAVVGLLAGGLFVVKVMIGF
jgi:hypothetical protein